MNSSSHKHSLTIAVSLLFTLLTALATLGSTTFFSRTFKTSANSSGRKTMAASPDAAAATAPDKASQARVIEVYVPALPRAFDTSFDGPFAYVVNYEASSVAVINVSTNTVVATVAVGFHPFGVAITPDGAHAYVTFYGSVDPPLPGGVTIIDTATHTVTATINLPVGVLPNEAAITPDGSRLYTANNGQSTVSVFDITTNTLLTTIPINSRSYGIVITPDGTRAYVTNIFANNVSVIDMTTNTVTASVAVGAFPSGVAVKPDGTRAYVVNVGSGSVSAINTATNTVVATIPVGSNPHEIAITPDGTRAYVTTGPNDGQVRVIDTDTNTVTATVPVGGDTRGVAITSDGTRVYVGGEYPSSSVIVIDTTTNTPVAAVGVDCCPRQLAITPSSPTPTPTLGDYSDASILLSTNTTVIPNAPPTDTTSINVSTSTDFKGKLEGDPATGVVRVTDAHPAGTYTVTVRAFSSGGATTTKTFQLTVTPPPTCTPVSFAAAANYGAGSNPYSVAVGDFNGDAKQDLAVTNQSSDSVSILLRDCAATPTPASPGQLIISEFRLQGTTPEDEFIELYNNTDAPINILNCQLTINETLPRSTSIALGTPGPSIIPPRGHYLVSHQTGYTLSAYAAGDIIYSFGFNFMPDAGITLHNTTNVLLDKVGFTTSPAGSCEGTCLTPTNATGQYSFARRMETGPPKDSNNNAADFILVATDPAPFGGAARLGAPGPKNTTSPLPKLLLLMPGLLIDPTVGSSASPNRTRDTAPYTDVLTPSGPDGNPATPYALGTLSVQRRVLNNTGQPVTRLRFRVIDVTTLSTPYYISGGTQADVRVLSSNGTTRAPSVLPPGVSLKGVTLEQSGGQMNQLKGGGWNSSLAAGTITMATPLPANDDPSTPNVVENALDVQFLLAVVSSGNFRFYVIVESLP